MGIYERRFNHHRPQDKLSHTLAVSDMREGPTSPDPVLQAFVAAINTRY